MITQKGKSKYESEINALCSRVQSMCPLGWKASRCMALSLFGNASKEMIMVRCEYDYRAESKLPASQRYLLHGKRIEMAKIIFGTISDNNDLIATLDGASVYVRGV